MKATKNKIHGLILAGGYSKRMGQDKALLDFHGIPQVNYLFDLLHKYCAEVYLSKRTDQGAYRNIPYINDTQEFIGHGPLGGILSAMINGPENDWLVVACDLPYVTEEALEMLISHSDPAKCATAFMSTQDGLPEPLCAIWRRHAYGHFLKLFNEGIHCPRKILINSNTQLLEQTDGHWLDNINTLQEYEQIKNKLA